MSIGFFFWWNSHNWWKFYVLSQSSHLKSLKIVLRTCIKFKTIFKNDYQISVSTVRVCEIWTTSSSQCYPPNSVWLEPHYDRIWTRHWAFCLQVPVQDSGISPRGTGHQPFSIPAAWSFRNSVPEKSRLRDLGDLFLSPAPTSWKEPHSNVGRSAILGLQLLSPQLPQGVEVLC